MTYINSLKDVIYVLGLTINLLAVQPMATGGFGFHEKGHFITLCGGCLRFPVIDDTYSSYSSPVTTRMFRTMPYIRDAQRNDDRPIVTAVQDPDEGPDFLNEENSPNVERSPLNSSGKR